MNPQSLPAWNPPPMLGGIEGDPRRSGFLSQMAGDPVQSQPIGQLGQLNLTPEYRNAMAQIQRGEVVGDISQILRQLDMTMNQFSRAITSSTSGLPIRENLEAETTLLTPMDTPFRNKLPRIKGAGLASIWRQVTSLGAGWGVSTTVTTGASSVTQTVGATAGMQAGDVLFVYTPGTGASTTRIVSSVTNATTVVLTVALDSTTADVISKFDIQGPQPNAAIATFYAETGTPAAHTTAYASKTVSYKLLGTFGSVTGLAMAAGANFQDQLAVEKMNAIRNLMLNEENALINGSSTDVKAPWGDGSTAFGFDGIRNLVTTANGVPAGQVQALNGNLTFPHMDAQLGRLYTQGGQNPYLLVNETEARSIAHLATATGSILRVDVAKQGETTVGVRVTGYVDPVSGTVVPILTSRFVPPGLMFFLSSSTPDGRPAIDVSVLPQVNLPELAPNQNVQGYTAQEVAPTTGAPQVYPFIVTVFEVLRLKSALHVGVSSGLVAV